MPQRSAIHLIAVLAMLSAPAAATAERGPWCYVPRRHARVDCGYDSLRQCLVAAGFRLDGGACARNHPTLKPTPGTSNVTPRG